MLRPSDIATKAVHFDSQDNESKTVVVYYWQYIFSAIWRSNNHFPRNWKWHCTHRIPGHYLQLAQEPINLILFEHFGITLTGLVINQQPQENPVFLAFTPPYGSITAKTVANVMNEAVDAVGLSGQGFSAKSFRPTGATLAVESGCDPEIAMQIGRWKTKSVFYEHYVHSKPPVTFSDNIWFQEYSLVDHQRCHLRSLTCSFILLKMSTPL